MINWKKLGLSLVFPPLWILIPAVVASIGLMAVSLIFFGSEHPVTYMAYALSAYALTVVCFRIPRIVRFVKRIKEENRHIHRLTTDAHLRVKLSLYGSLAYNLAYAVFQFGLGLWHGSAWFYSFAAYYFLLSVMRFFLLRDVRSLTPGEQLEREYKRYRFCGVLLAVMTATLAGITVYITQLGYGFEHHYITTIAMAAYTFTAMTVAIVNVVRYRRFKSPLFSASKAINLAAACVSMLTLETAMLAAFSENESDTFRPIMTTVTGVGVCAFVLAIAIYMIVRANKKLKEPYHP